MLRLPDHFDPEERGARAREYFLEGYNCCQAVLLAFSDVLEDNGQASEELLKTIGSGFGGGFARLREVCGSENKMNMLLPWKPNTQTGLPGVSPNGNKFQTKIHGKSFYFHDPYEAFYHLTLLGRRYKSEKV